LGGRMLLRPALRWIARSDSPEIFTAAALLLVVATAALMQSVGLSMALGAFLAGVLLAESEYRRELETDIEPFKGLLLGLFFIAIGMTIDFSVVREQPLLVAAIVFGLLAVKAVVLWGMSRLIPLPAGERPLFIALLAQGGEVGFVVLQSGAGVGVVDGQANSVLTAAIALSMLVTPLLVLLADRLSRRHETPARTLDEISEDQHAPVIIAGFGRYGQIVARLINANGLSATVLDHDVELLDVIRKFGWPAFYGDATRLDLLRVAGADHAKVFVLAIDDVDQSVEIAKMVREQFPHLTIVARARDVTHYYKLLQLGVTLIERETFDAALMSARSVLELMGWEPHAARNQALRFRRHNIDLVEQMAPHLGDQNKLIAMAKQGRQQLEELWARERAQNAGQRARAVWHAPNADAEANAEGPSSEDRPTPASGR
ncbi:MAG: cation:proton antiporter, partial [Rubrivivax sp.]